MLSAHSFAPRKDACEKAPSSVASTCDDLGEEPLLSREASIESLVNRPCDVIQGETGVASQAQGVSRVPLAQKRFAIRMQEEDQITFDRQEPRRCPASEDDVAPPQLSFMQKRFAIRMAEDEDAWLVSPQTETCQQARGVCPAAVTECPAARGSLVQRRFAIRMQEEPRYSSACRSAKSSEQLSERRLGDQSASPRPATVARQGDESMPHKASPVPLAQKRFAIRMQHSGVPSVWEAQQQCGTSEQREPRAATATMAQKRFAIRMPDVHGEGLDVSLEPAAVRIDLQPAPAMLSQKWSARMHDVSFASTI